MGVFLTNKNSMDTLLEKKYCGKYKDFIESTKKTDTDFDCISFIENNYNIDYEKFNELNNHIDSIPWDWVLLTIYLEPYSTPRPRYNHKTNSFYVKGAKEHKEVMKNMIKDFNIIYTSTKIIIKTYELPPIKSLKPHELLLAEMGKIRPYTKDWDNIGKTYSDMIQGYILLNDNLIVDGRVQKFYSILPRIGILIEYQTDFDSDYNKKKILGSKLLNKLPPNIKITYSGMEGGTK